MLAGFGLWFFVMALKKIKRKLINTIFTNTILYKVKKKTYTKKNKKIIFLA